MGIEDPEPHASIWLEGPRLIPHDEVQGRPVQHPELSPRLGTEVEAAYGEVVWLNIRLGLRYM